MAIRRTIISQPSLFRAALLTAIRSAHQGSKPRKSKCVRFECRQGEPYDVCQSLVKCGPCRKYTYMDIRCSVALVTGGACGIGFSTANELLCQEAYRVVIADKDTKRGLKAQEILQKVHGKNRVCFMPLDVNLLESFQRVFTVGHELHGGFDIIINNAVDVSDIKWERAIDTNLKGVVRGCLLGFEWLQKQKAVPGGVIINMCSTSGLDSDRRTPMLSTAKHGVVGLSKTLGSPIYFQKTGVRVVGLCPGKTKPSQKENLTDLSPELQAVYYDPKFPGQDPEKVARAVTYVIRYAPSGSIWIAEDSQLYRTVIPRRKQISTITDVV